VAYDEQHCDQYPYRRSSSLMCRKPKLHLFPSSFCAPKQELCRSFHPLSPRENLQRKLSSIAISNQTSCIHAMPQSSALLPVQLAGIEAVHVVWEMLCEGHHKDFVVFEGAALLLDCGGIMTKDADLAVTGPSSTTFINLAREDSRVSEGVFEEWENNLFIDFQVKKYFLDKQGDG